MRWLFTLCLTKTFILPTKTIIYRNGKDICFYVVCCVHSTNKIIGWHTGRKGESESVSVCVREWKKTKKTSLYLYGIGSVRRLHDCCLLCIELLLFFGRLFFAVSFPIHLLNSMTPYPHIDHAHTLCVWHSRTHFTCIKPQKPIVWVGNSSSISPCAPVCVWIVAGVCDIFIYYYFESMSYRPNNATSIFLSLLNSTHRRWTWQTAFFLLFTLIRYTSTWMLRSECTSTEIQWKYCWFSWFFHCKYKHKKKDADHSNASDKSTMVQLPLCFAHVCHTVHSSHTFRIIYLCIACHFCLFPIPSGLLPVRPA